MPSWTWFNNNKITKGLVIQKSMQKASIRQRIIKKLELKKKKQIVWWRSRQMYKFTVEINHSKNDTALWAQLSLGWSSIWACMEISFHSDSPNNHKTFYWSTNCPLMTTWIFLSHESVKRSLIWFLNLTLILFFLYS